MCLMCSLDRVDGGPFLAPLRHAECVEQCPSSRAKHAPDTGRNGEQAYRHHDPYIVTRPYEQQPRHRLDRVADGEEKARRSRIDLLGELLPFHLDGRLDLVDEACLRSRLLARKARGRRGSCRGKERRRLSSPVPHRLEHH